MCAAQVCMPPLYGHPCPALCAGCVCRIILGYLGLPSVLQGLCALAGLVCRAILGPGSQPSVWGHSPRAVNGRRGVAFSVYCPPSPCFAWFSKTQLPFGPACEGVSLCMETPVSGLPPSLRAQASTQKFSVLFSLFMSPSSLLPHFWKLTCPLGVLGSSAVSYRLLCRSCSTS